MTEQTPSRHDQEKVPAAKSGRAGTFAMIGALVVIAAVATLVQTYRVGDSGARAAWGNVTSSSGQ